MVHSCHAYNLQREHSIINLTQEPTTSRFFHNHHNLSHVDHTRNYFATFLIFFKFVGCPTMCSLVDLLRWCRFFTTVEGVQCNALIAARILSCLRVQNYTKCGCRNLSLVSIKNVCLSMCFISPPCGWFSMEQISALQRKDTPSQCTGEMECV